MDDETNPLLDTTGLPRFDAIQIAHIEPGIERLLKDVGSELDGLEKRFDQGAQPAWETLVEPLERLLDRVKPSGEFDGGNLFAGLDSLGILFEGQIDHNRLVLAQMRMPLEHVLGIERSIPRPLLDDLDNLPFGLFDR